MSHSGGCCVCPRAHTAARPKGRYIDLYLIAGQSNAAGYSSVSGVTRQTFSNVMYAGEVNRPVGASGGSNSYLADFADSVTTGLGRSGNYIGPEYGIAEVLDQLYTGDHKALIFKSAAGGTSLQNTNSGESATYGNWLPPSERNNYPENAATGVQYDVFMENFTAVYNKLVAQGYTPRVRGMAWMQGEADRSAPGTYKSLIQTFIADIRADLSDVTGADLSQMPFVMGEISDTFGSYGNVNTNRAFNDMLHEAASLVPGTAVTESGRYVINDANGIVGTDQYHWSGPDMEEIGMLFAEEILALASDIVRVNLDDTVSGTAVFSNGAVTYAFDDGTLTLTPAAAARVLSRLAHRKRHAGGGDRRAVYGRRSGRRRRTGRRLLPAARLPALLRIGRIDGHRRRRPSANLVRIRPDVHHTRVAQAGLRGGRRDL